MKQLFLKNAMSLILEYHNNYSDEDIARLKYGLEGLYLTITKLVIIILGSFLLGIGTEILLVLVFLNIIRFPAFGFHANSSKSCLIFSSLLIVGLPYLFLHITIPTFMKYILCGIGLLCYILYAPADTAKRPLLNKKKRFIRKIASVCISLVYIYMAIWSQNSIIATILLSSLLIEAIAIHPLTYRMFGQSYANYRNFL